MVFKSEEKILLGFSLEFHYNYIFTEEIGPVKIFIMLSKNIACCSCHFKKIFFYDKILSSLMKLFLDDLCYECERTYLNIFLGHRL